MLRHLTMHTISAATAISLCTACSAPMVGPETGTNEEAPTTLPSAPPATSLDTEFEAKSEIPGHDCPVEDPLKWVETYNGGYYEHGNALAIDGAGNLAVGGTTHLGAWVRKFSPDGSPLWTKADKGNGAGTYRGESLAFDSQGNIVFVGSADDGQIVVPVSRAPSKADNTNRHAEGVNVNVYINKYDADGETVWTKLYDTSMHDFGVDVAIDSDDNVLVTGNVENLDDIDLWVGKYSKDGDKLWTKTYRGEMVDGGKGIASNQDGSLVVGGHTDVLVDEDPISVNVDAWIGKYSGDGELMWNVIIPGDAQEVINDVAIDPDGNIVVVGTIDHGDSLVTLNTDIWLAKYDQNGDELWTKTYDGGRDDTAKSLAFDLNGNYAIAGSTATDDGIDMLLQKYSRSGDRQWSRQYNCGTTDRATGIVSDSSGHWLVGGWFENGERLHDVWLAKYAP